MAPCMQTILHKMQYILDILLYISYTEDKKTEIKSAACIASTGWKGDS